MSTRSSCVHLDLVAKIAKRRKAGWESRWRWTVTGGTPPDNPIIFDPCHKDNPGDLEKYHKQITKLRIQKLLGGCTGSTERRGRQRSNRSNETEGNEGRDYSLAGMATLLTASNILEPAR
jgi:hypothetical protein